MGFGTMFVAVAVGLGRGVLLGVGCDGATVKVWLVANRVYPSFARSLRWYVPAGNVAGRGNVHDPEARAVEAVFEQPTYSQVS